MTEANVMQKYFGLALSADPDEREEAARELKAFFRHIPAVDALLGLLGDSDWRVRRAAVESFVEMRPHETIPRILEALYDEENAGKRNAAIDILTKFGKEVVPYLEPHLSTRNQDVHMFLINILGDLRDDAFLDFITGSLKHPDLNISSAAIIALGKIGHPESLPYLLPFLDGKDMWLTFQAIEAAGEMQDPATISTLMTLSGTQYFRKPVIKAFSNFHHTDTYRALAKFLIHNNEVDLDAVRALNGLYHFACPTELQEEEQKKLRQELQNSLSQETIRILLKEAARADVEVRRMLIEILGWAKAGEAIPFFIESLQNPELAEPASMALIWCNREASDSLMEEIRSAHSEEELLTALSILNEMSEAPDTSGLDPLLVHDVPEIRLMAYRLRTRITSPESIPLLIRGVMDSHEPVSAVCREPLLSLCRRSKTVRQEVSERMQASVQSSDPLHRANAIEFLALLEGEQAFPLLFQALKDEEALVRQRAVSLMGTGYHSQFQRPLIAALADEDARVRELAATALESYSSPEVVEGLLSSIRDEMIWVRLATYQSLAAIGEDRAVTAFLQQLETEAPMARAVLLRGLGRFRSPASKEALLRYLNSDDPELRKCACESLGVFNDNDIVFRLFTLMQNDSDWAVRVAAVRALTSIRPFRLQEALIERLRADEDAFVRKEILASLQQLGTDYLPAEIYEYLLDKNLADAAYRFLVSGKARFSKQIQEDSSTQSPAVRRILKSVLD